VTSTVRIALLALAFAMMTLAVGWWGVAVVGVLWGWWSGRTPSRPILHAAIAAVLGWAGWLGVTAARGELVALADRLGTVLGQPAVLPLGATLGIAAVLAGLGTWAGLAIRGLPGPSRAP